MTKVADLEKIESGEFKAQLAENLSRVDKLLQGRLQGPEVRKLLWGVKMSEEDYPSLHEIHDSFHLKHPILKKVSQITRESFEDGREREVFVGVRNGNYVFSETNTGTQNLIPENRVKYFPSDMGDFVLMEMHTHPGSERLYIPSPPDIASFIVEERHIPMMLVSAETGAWLLIKAREFFAGDTAGLNEFAFIKKIDNWHQDFEQKYRSP